MQNRKGFFSLIGVLLTLLILGTLLSIFFISFSRQKSSGITQDRLLENTKEKIEQLHKRQGILREEIEKTQ